MVEEEEVTEAVEEEVAEEVVVGGGGGGGGGVRVCAGPHQSSASTIILRVLVWSHCRAMRCRTSSESPTSAR